MTAPARSFFSRARAQCRPAGQPILVQPGSPPCSSLPLVFLSSSLCRRRMGPARHHLLPQANRVHHGHAAAHDFESTRDSIPRRDQLLAQDSLLYIPLPRPCFSLKNHCPRPSPPPARTRRSSRDPPQRRRLAPPLPRPASHCRCHQPPRHDASCLPVSSPDADEPRSHCSVRADVAPPSSPSPAGVLYFFGKSFPSVRSTTNAPD